MRRSPCQSTTESSTANSDKGAPTMKNALRHRATKAQISWEPSNISRVTAQIPPDDLTVPTDQFDPGTKAQVIWEPQAYALAA